MQTPNDQRLISSGGVKGSQYSKYQTVKLSKENTCLGSVPILNASTMSKQDEPNVES